MEFSAQREVEILQAVAIMRLLPATSIVKGVLCLQADGIKQALLDQDMKQFVRLKRAVRKQRDLLDDPVLVDALSGVITLLCLECSNPTTSTGCGCGAKMSQCTVCNIWSCPDGCTDHLECPSCPNWI